MRTLLVSTVTLCLCLAWPLASGADEPIAEVDDAASVVPSAPGETAEGPAAADALAPSEQVGPAPAPEGEPAPPEAEVDVPALVAEAEGLLDAGEIDGAVVILERAVAADPRSPQAVLRLGGGYLLQGRYIASVEAFQVAIGLQPGNAAAFNGLGIAYLHQGMYGQARAAFEEARRLDPSMAADIDRILETLDEGTPPTPSAGPAPPMTPAP